MSALVRLIAATALAVSLVGCTSAQSPAWSYPPVASPGASVAPSAMASTGPAASLVPSPTPVAGWYGPDELAAAAKENALIGQSIRSICSVGIEDALCPRLIETAAAATRLGNPAFGEIVSAHVAPLVAGESLVTLRSFLGGSAAVSVATTDAAGLRARLAELLPSPWATDPHLRARTRLAPLLKTAPASLKERRAVLYCGESNDYEIDGRAAACFVSAYAAGLEVEMLSIGMGIEGQILSLWRAEAGSKVTISTQDIDSTGAPADWWQQTCTTMLLGATGLVGCGLHEGEMRRIEE